MVVGFIYFEIRFLSDEISKFMAINLYFCTTNFSQRISSFNFEYVWVILLLHFTLCLHSLLIRMLAWKQVQPKNIPFRINIFVIPFSMYWITEHFWKFNFNITFSTKNKNELNKGRNVQQQLAEIRPINKVGKIRNILTRRREYGTYLATARRHCRRLKMQKRDE